MTQRGLFITFEGGEGAGKTTQIRRLAAALLGDTILTREPGGTPEGDALRDVFIDHQGQDWPPRALLLLMFSARALHVERLIAPALAAGQSVLCDRFTDSTRVYQGYAGGLPLDAIESVKQAAIGDLEPDITFILDLPPEEGLRRAAARGKDGDTFEARHLDFHRSLRRGFLEIATRHPARCVVIDASFDEDTIAAEILAHVRARLAGGGGASPTAQRTAEAIQPEPAAQNKPGATAAAALQASSGEPPQTSTPAPTQAEAAPHPEKGAKEGARDV